MTPPVLIFAIGNESRGDDALGPLLLRQLDSWLKENNLADQFELLEEFQLQVEHAMDLKDRQLVLFIDAGAKTRAPYAFYRATANATPTLYSHALTPEALLKVYEPFYHEAPPPVFVLCVCGEQFELGEPLSAVASVHLLRAFEFSQKLLLDAKNEAWEQETITMQPHF